MKILVTGTLSGITGAVIGSGISTPPICIAEAESIYRPFSNLSVWLALTGDLGRTGGSICIFWRGAYQRSGVTYAYPATGQYICKSGTSVTGVMLDGTYLKSISPIINYIRFEGIASKSGSTQHGTGTTNSIIASYAVVGH